VTALVSLMTQKEATRKETELCKCSRHAIATASAAAFTYKRLLIT
jgi:hypothetical protein